MRELRSESLIRDEERMKARLGGCGDEMQYPARPSPSRPERSRVRVARLRGGPGASVSCTSLSVVGAGARRSSARPSEAARPRSAISAEKLRPDTGGHVLRVLGRMSRSR